MLDCPDPKVLAEFYTRLLGLRVLEEEPDWITLGDGSGPKVAMQRAEQFTARTWPDPFCLVTG